MIKLYYSTFFFKIIFCERSKIYEELKEKHSGLGRNLKLRKLKRKGMNVRKVLLSVDLA